MKNRTGEKPVIVNNPFTLVEMLMVVAVIIMLMAMLLPSLQLAKESSRGIACVSNLKQFGVAHLSYAGDWNGWLTQSNYYEPNSSKNWVGLVSEYVNWKATPSDRFTVWHCPSGIPRTIFTPAQSAGYTINNDIITDYRDAGKLIKIMTPSIFVLMIDFCTPAYTHQEYQVGRVGANGGSYAVSINDPAYMTLIDYRHIRYKKTGILHVDGSAKLHFRYQGGSYIPGDIRWRNRHGVYQADGTFLAD